MSNFESNNRERKSYEQLERVISKNGIGISGTVYDVNLYLARLYNKFSQILKNNNYLLTESKAQNKDYRNVLQENLRVLYEELLSKTALLESLRYSHNQQFSVIGNRIKKPLVLEANDVRAMFLKTENDSVLELLAKNMDWLSKTAKEVESVRKNILEKISGQTEINYFTIEYIYEYISSVCINGKLLKDYLISFEGNLSDEGKVNSDEVLKRIKEMISDTNKNFNTKINITDLYKYASCKKLQEYLYKGKAFMQIELYRQEAKKRKTGEKTGVSLDIERDKNMNGTNFNTGYNVYIPYYTNSFRDHSDISEFSYIIHQQVLEGDDPLEFPLDYLEEIPFRPYITFKFDFSRILDLYSILEEYDNPKVNCFMNDSNKERLNKVYGYFSDALHYSINGENGDLSRLLKEGKIPEFKEQVRKDREAFLKKIDDKSSQKAFEED